VILLRVLPSEMHINIKPIVFHILLSSSLFLFSVCGNSPLTLKYGNAAEIMEQAKSHTDREVVLLNFWATWCKPCVKEFPMIVELSRNYKKRGLIVYFISVDWLENEDQVKIFLKAQGVKGISYIKDRQNDELFINDISNSWSGAVPFTILIDKQGNLAEQWESEKSEEYFIKALEKVVDPINL